MKLAALALDGMMFIAASFWTSCSSEAADAADSGSTRAIATPQDAVACTGSHALCTSSPDCRLHGNEADCDCMRVDETHIVLTNEILDPEIKRLTQAQCANEHPCNTDQAPVCEAIRNGRYTVDGVPYDWVSTYSYRGWCTLLQQPFRICDPHAAGYRGDTNWAVCDAVPCTENPSPSNPEKPLICRCRVETTPFVGANGSCTGENGGIMSTFSVSLWDFKRNTYTIPMPGYEFVQGACAPLRSDPLPLGRTGAH